MIPIGCGCQNRFLDTNIAGAILVGKVVHGGLGWFCAEGSPSRKNIYNETRSETGSIYKVS